MFHRIARWLISRSIDEDRSVPHWLRSWIDRNEGLKDFETMSRQIGRQLKSDAREWISSQALPGRVESVLSRRLFTPNAVSLARVRIMRRSVGAMILGTTGVAACAWFTIGHFRSHSDQVKQSDAEGGRPIAEAHPTGTITSADREWLATVWRRSRTKLGQLQARATSLPGGAEILNLPSRSAIMQPAQVVASTTGRALAMLDRGIDSEQKQLTSDARAAFSFFAHRLPASLAKLVGWTERK